MNDGPAESGATPREVLEKESGRSVDARFDRLISSGLAREFLQERPDSQTFRRAIMLPIPADDSVQVTILDSIRSGKFDDMQKSTEGFDHFVVITDEGDLIRMQATPTDRVTDNRFRGKARVNLAYPQISTGIQHTDGQEFVTDLHQTLSANFGEFESTTSLDYQSRRDLESEMRLLNNAVNLAEAVAHEKELRATHDEAMPQNAERYRTEGRASALNIVTGITSRNLRLEPIPATPPPAPDLPPPTT